MASTKIAPPTVTNRDFIPGTRITLYDVMDYLTDDWPPRLVQQWLNLSAEQMADVMAYVEANRKELEREYRRVLSHAEENRRYWEERNRERFARIAAKSSNSGQEELRAKLHSWKARLAEA